MNNAGMAIKGDDFNEKVVADAFKTNFYGTSIFYNIHSFS